MWRWIRPASLIVMVGCLASAKAFGVFFAADDFVYMAYAESRPWPGFSDAAAHRWLSGAGAFYACRRLFGLDAGLFHVPVVLAHIANALLLWRLVLRLEPTRPYFALVAAVLFVGHAAAFTVLAWLSAGFNEAPALTAALVATHLTLTGMKRRSIWMGCVTGGVIFLATGIKQHVVLAVAYVAMFGLYYGMKTLRTGHRPAWYPLVAAIIVVSGVAVWLATVVVPRMPVDLFKPPYTRVYAPASVGASYVRYLPHALNPLAFAREPLGYQGALPARLYEATRTRPTVLRTGILIAWALALWAGARRLGLLPLAATAAAVLVAALSVAVVLPDHQYDYYAYFGLPAASMLAAMAIGAVWRVVRADGPLSRVLLPASTLALFVAAWCQGLLLASANAVVQNSQHTRLIDRVAEIAPSQSTLYFLPPVSRVREDTLQGASVALLRPDKGLTTQFAETSGIPDTFAAHPGMWLVATRRGAAGDWEAALLDSAQWRNAEGSVRLADGAELRQPFTVGGTSVAAVHVGVSPWRGRCDVAFAIHATADGAAEPGEPLAYGRLDCDRDITNGFAEFPVMPGRIVRGRYVLSLRVESGALEFPVARAGDIGFDPLSYRHGGAWERRQHTLAIRSVLRLVENRADYR
jgi:hypothetical protein